MPFWIFVFEREGGSWLGTHPPARLLCRVDSSLWCWQLVCHWEKKTDSRLYTTFFCSFSFIFVFLWIRREQLSCCPFVVAQVGKQRSEWRYPGPISAERERRPWRLDAAIARPHVAALKTKIYSSVGSGRRPWRRGDIFVPSGSAV